jgi:subtilisin family serine protease
MRKKQAVRGGLAAWLAFAAVLGGCGGGEQTVSAEPEAQALSADVEADVSEEEGTVEVIEPLDTSGLDPALIPADEQAELDALNPEDAAGSVHYLVQLNPAAVRAQASQAARILRAGVAPGRAGTQAAVRSIANRLGASHGARIKTAFATGSTGYSVSISREQAQAYIESLARDPDVVGLELDRIAKPSAVAVPRDVSSVWGVDRIDEGARVLNRVYAPPATGEGVKVHVIDSGIRTTHQEFRGRQITSVNYYGGVNTDCMGHGSHVAGTIGGATYGVAPDATLVSHKVFGCSGGTASSLIIQAMEAVLDDTAPRRVLNMSLGSSYSAYMNSVVQRLVDGNVAVVVAAGNEATDACNRSPASAPGALTVAATTSTDQMASFSNYGSCVDLAAPGASIRSAGYASDSEVRDLNGTSMASPHAAGAAALLWELRPNATAGEIIATLPAVATPGLMSLSGSRATTPNRLLFVGTQDGPSPQVRVARIASVMPSVTITGPVSFVPSFAVRVVDADGEAVALAKVKAYVSHSNRALFCTTDQTGTCSIKTGKADWRVRGSVTLNVAGVTPATSTTGLTIYDATANATNSATAQPASITAHLGRWTTTLTKLSTSSWSGTAVLTVLDGDDQPVSGVYAYVKRNGGVTRACRTTAEGQCTLATGTLKVSTTPQYTYEVTAIKVPGLAYDAAGQADGAARVSLDYLPRRYAGIQAMSATRKYTNSNRTFWNAAVTVTARRADDADASGLTVTGRWSTSSSTVSCKTDATGTCTLNTPALSVSKVPAARFMITNVRAYSTYYDPALDSLSQLELGRPW